MASTVFNSTHQLEYVEQTKGSTLLQRFFSWCRSQEGNRLIWLGVVLAVHGCFLTPFTIIAIAFSGLNLLLFYFAIGAMAISLIPNLAAQPTRITLPLFFLSILVDLVIVVYCATQGFSAANVY